LFESVTICAQSFETQFKRMHYWVGQGEAAVAVTLFSVGNGLGRVVSSSLSDWAHRRRLFARPVRPNRSFQYCLQAFVLSLALETTDRFWSETALQSSPKSRFLCLLISQMCLAILSMVMGSAHLLMALPLGLTGVDGFYTAVFIAAGNHII
jgi:hypothetical protein